ncbi:hypothetical protein AC578_10907 [Pseudocercospora eumusae]|uniref:Cytochrome P450 monooxygenase n=1 Tax=Pseudocercospora eumusae TaxID=321146 RepID=A0A139HFA3_9PEZI|nr:hypothetical protein AC578_10907 [Pseudocercospora eumusae]
MKLSFLRTALIAAGLFGYWLVLRLRVAIRRRRAVASLPYAELPGQNRLESWFKDSNKLVEEGCRKYAGSFQVQTGTGPFVIVRNRFAAQFANDGALSVAEVLRRDGFADYPGFEAARVSIHSSVIREVLLQKLTPALDAIRPGLVADAQKSLLDNFPPKTEWSAVAIHSPVLDIVARMSSRPFAGERLCTDAKWLEIQKRYATVSSLAAGALRKKARWFRPIVHWFMPECIQLRQLVQDARSLVRAELEERTARQNHVTTADAIAWLEEQSQKSCVPIDIAAAQLQLSMVAIQTASHTLCHALQHLCEHSRYQLTLREELKAVIKKDGWSKAGIYNLKQMDSFLKESLRITQGRLAMARVAMKDITFSDGTIVPAQMGCMLESNFHDSALYTRPHEFDPARFERIRAQRAQARGWQYISCGAEDLGFGYGLHSCPGTSEICSCIRTSLLMTTLGRFFASNVVKIALGHLLLWYDWTADPGCDIALERETESTGSSDPNKRLWYRRHRDSLTQST